MISHQQIFFRKRGSFVWKVRLFADQCNTPFEALLPERNRGVSAAMACADNQNIEVTGFLADIINPPGRRLH